jgi:tetratricopeptide (TPR) repeat protein
MPSRPSSSAIWNNHRRYAKPLSARYWPGSRLEKHPNIVRCFHMDSLDNQPFMVLEWIADEEGKGVDLRGWLRQGPLALQQALDFAIGICYGLVHAQQKHPGIVHRDLKPENILIAQGGLAKITDFGLAQMVVQADLKVAEWAAPGSPAAPHPQQSMAAQGGIAGTPPYMPPEQWQPGVSLDERADIYAVGCILYEMLTGRPPFAVDIQPTTPATYQRWLSAWQWQHEHAARPMIPDTIPAPLAELLVNCLARNRDERHQTITDLLARLQQVYTHFFGQPPRSAPVSSEFSFVDYNNRGATYNALGRYEDALADYGEAIRLNPAEAEAYNNRGLTYHALGQHEAALAEYDQAIRINPAFAKAYNNRGTTYDALGRHGEALAEYNQAIHLNPALAAAYTNRGTTYHALGRHGEALADFAEAIRINPAFAAAFFNRGLTYAALGQHEKALAEYDQAIRLNPADEEASYNRGNTYAALGRHEKALAEYDQAIRLNPTYAEVHFNCGALLANMGRLHDSLPYFEKAAQLGVPQAVQVIAQVRQRLGETPALTNPLQQAFDAFQQAGSSAAVAQVVAQYPFMVDEAFMAAVEQAINQQVPPEHRPAFEQRLTWLRQIAAKQKESR